MYIHGLYTPEHCLVSRRSAIASRCLSVDESGSSTYTCALQHSTHMNGAGASSSHSAGRTAAPATVYLSPDLISKALSSSNDHGQTLDLSHCDLTEVTEANANDLAGAAVDPDDGESNVLRYAPGRASESYADPQPALPWATTVSQRCRKRSWP